MAIKPGIQPGAILWKYSEEVERSYYDYGEKKHLKRKIQVYRHVVLVTRRGRSQGSRISDSVYPFLNALNIIMIPHTMHSWDDKQSYTAVGTNIVAVTKEFWDSSPIDTTALRWYSRLKNFGLRSLLHKRDESFSFEIIQEMKDNLVDDDSPIEWLPEVRHGLVATSSSRHVHRVVW